MKTMLFWLIGCLTFASYIYAQTIEDAQQAARQMGYTETLKLQRTTSTGRTVFSGNGLSLGYGGSMAGNRTLRTTIDSALNRDRKQVRSAEEAVSLTKAFIACTGPPLGIVPPGEALVVEVEEKSDPSYSGWEVSIHTLDNGHKSYPMYSAKVDRSGAVVGLMFLPLANTVAKEPRLTQDAARDALLKSRGISGSAICSASELKVVPNQKGGCALAWVLELELTQKGSNGLSGAVDATTGEVLFSAGNMYSPPTPAAPANGQPMPQPTADPPASDTVFLPLVAYTLATLAVLLVIFLVVKLRKR